MEPLDDPQLSDSVPAKPAPVQGTEHKIWYRKLERTLDAIERSEDMAGMLGA